MQVSKQHVSDLLENFAEYLDQETGDPNPWFTIDEVVRQFPWEYPLGQPLGYLEELVADGLVEQSTNDVEPIWRWAR